MLSAPASPLAESANPISGLFGLGGGGTGVPVFSFLKLPVSARAIGQGSATLTTDEEATVVQGNPAGLALVNDYYYSLSHAEILGEFRHENLALTFPTEVYGTFGGSANVLAATAFTDARDIDEQPAVPSAYDVALGLAYAKTVIENTFTAGGRIDLIRSSLDGTVAYGYGINAGLMFLLIDDMRLGFVIKNLSHGARYDTKTAPLEPLPLGLGLELGKPLFDSRWSGQAGFLQTNEGALHYYGGVEWRLIKYLVLRAGYDGSSQDRQIGPWSGLAGGLGIKYDRLTLDYGYKSLGPLGAYHAFTLNYSRKAKFRPRDEVLMAEAQEKYRKGNYKSALRSAKAAVAANPYNFKAQALAQKLQLEIERMDETAVTLYFTANTEGCIGSLWTGGRPLGGLARRKTKLIELKGAPGKSLILDAGDLTKPGTNLGQESFVYGAYAQMPYDAVNVGASEVTMGAERWDARLPWMCGRKPAGKPPGPLINEKILPLKHGGLVLVLGALEPRTPKGEALRGKELDSVADEVSKHLADSKYDSKKGRIVILLLNGSVRGAQLLAQKVPELDAVILSGETDAMGSPMKAGRTLICSPGRGGTYIGSLTYMLDRHDKIRSFRHLLIPLDATIPEDPELEKFLAPVTIDPNKLSLDGWDDDYHAQVFAYVLSPAPTGGGKVFLRDLRTGRNYGVPTEGLACSNPVLGYGKNRVAFAGEDSAGAKEIYAYAPGIERLDTLTHMGGKAVDMHWILGNNALLAVYAKDGKSELYRIDPWSRDVRNLSKGRFGKVRGFGIAKTGDRIAVNAWDGKASTLWVTNAEMESPLAIATDLRFIGSPRWNPQGDKLAFLTAFTGDTANGDEGPGELRVFDFAAKKLISATEHSRVRSYAWSADGRKVFYAAGVNLADINAFNLDSMSLGKVTNPAANPRSEENPMPKIFGNRDGLLFESAVDGGRTILWMDLADRSEKVMVDSAGYSRLK